MGPYRTACFVGASMLVAMSVLADGWYVGLYGGYTLISLRMFVISSPMI